MHVLFIIFLIFTIVIGAPTLLFAFKLIIGNGKTTAKTTGTVECYKEAEAGSFFQHSIFVYYPVFTFFADGEEYTSVLSFSRFKFVDKAEDARVVFRKSGKPTQKLYTCKDGHSIYDDPLKIAFPVGFKADVFYDPKNPKDNYAIRRTRQHPVFRFFLVLTAADAVLTVLFHHFSLL